MNYAGNISEVVIFGGQFDRANGREKEREGEKKKGYLKKLTILATKSLTCSNPTPFPFKQSNFPNPPIAFATLTLSFNCRASSPAAILFLVQFAKSSRRSNSVRSSDSSTEATSSSTLTTASIDSGGTLNQ